MSPPNCAAGDREDPHRRTAAADPLGYYRPVPDLEFTFIGSGNAFVQGGACWNGFAVNGRFLFEAPPQALMALNRLRIDPNALDAVVLSHHHGDHFLGLPFLLLHWKHLGRTKPVTVVGPPETEDVAREVCARTNPSLMKSTLPVRWLEVDAGARVEVAGLALEAVEVRHDPKLSGCLGYLATLEGRTFGYTGDSALCDGVLELARRSEVLVSECSSRDERQPTHMNLVDDMPRVRAAMAPGTQLVLTHLPADLGPVDLPDTRVAADFGRLRY